MNSRRRRTRNLCKSHPTPLPDVELRSVMSTVLGAFSLDLDEKRSTSEVGLIKVSLPSFFWETA
jgi:hypothetical protein